MMRISETCLKNLLAAATLICLAAGGGCTSVDTPQFSATSIKEFFENKEPVAAPESMAVVWTTAVLEKEATRPTRGFGGMVTFYEAKNKKPVRVKGELTIYAYENAANESEEAKPDRKYVFTAEQLEKHCGEAPIGPAYNIWIPWDEVDGPRREIGLIVRFDPVEGKPVMAKPTHNVLPGPGNKKGAVVATSFNEPVGLTHLPPVDEAAEAAAAGTKMKTATFSLPSRGNRPKSGNSE